MISFVLIALPIVFIFAAFKLVQHYCHCRDLEWMQFCKDKGLKSDKWPDYGYGKDDT